MDALADLFLGLNSFIMLGAVPVQSSSICVLGFRHRLSVCLFVFCSWVFMLNSTIFTSEFLRWMSRGNSKSHTNSWIGYCRLSRTMITGYKKKKLGHPSEKLSGDVPRASWRAVIFSEILFPVFMAILFVIAYLFVKSFPDSTGRFPPSPLIRIAVISLGPIVWNAAVLLFLFLVSLFLGPMLDPVFPKFGSVIAFIAHFRGVIGMLGFFEFLVSLSFKWGHREADFISFSGSSKHGTSLMPSWVLFAWSPFNVLFTKSLFPSSFRVNSNTMRRIGRGGLVVGMVVDLVPMWCRSLLASSSSRSLSSRYGVQIYSLDICCYSCLHLPFLYLTSIVSMQLYYVSFLISGL